MNKRLRARRESRVSRTVRMDDLDATKNINANIRAATGRGVVEDETDDAA